MQATLLLILSLALLSSCANFTLNLSVGRIDLAAAAVGTKAIFAGGLTAVGVATKLVDIYDVEAKVWTTANLSIARSSLIALSVGTKVLFCGGVNLSATANAVVDIYNDETGEWTTKTLNGIRENVKGTVVGTKVLFGGGKSLVGAILGVSDLVDIYDSETDTWTTELLLTARLSAAVTTVGDKALFIGGLDANANVLASIDIFDVVTGVWSTVNLTVTRTELSAVAVADVAVLAGGVLVNGTISNVVEIFDGTAFVLGRVLPVARCQMVSATDGVKAWFIGGATALTPSVQLSNRIDIYDPETDTWTFQLMAEARARLAAVNVGAMVFVAGGGDFSSLVEVFIDLVIGENTPTPTPANTPSPTPVVVPSPTPVATPTPTPNGLQCIADCILDFNNAKALFNASTYFSVQCGVYANHRSCLTNCIGGDVEIAVAVTACRATRWLSELCDCSGDGSEGAPLSARLVAILDNFRGVFLAYFNRLRGCSDAAIRTAAGVNLAFDFNYEDQDTDLAQVSVDLRALLAAYLNQNEARFQFDIDADVNTKRGSKRAVIAASLEAQVVESDPVPQPGSASGLVASYAFFLAITLFHLF